MQPCTLLAGETTCQTCGQPLSDFERQKITIRQDAASTTIARVTCPTAPKFWRWRDIPWPKVVQRDVEFLEHAEEANEWKAELVAAVLCGVLGLGRLVLPRPAALGDRLCAGLSRRQLVHRAGRLGAAAKARHRRPFPHARRRPRQRQHRRLGRRHDAAVPLLPFRRAGEFRAGPHPAGDPFAVPRSAQVRHRARRTGPGARGAGGEAAPGHAPAGQARRPVPGGCRNRQRPDRQRRIQPHRRSHARGEGHWRHRPRRHHQPLGRGRSARAASGGGEFLAEDHPSDQGRPAAESPGAAVH